MMRRESFTVTGQLLFDVATSSGDIEVMAADSGNVFVELRGGPADSYVVELHGSELNVHPPTRSSGKRRRASTDIKLFVPDGSGGRLETFSGDIRVAASLNALTLGTASGDCRVRGSVVADVSAKTASGDVRLGDVGGTVVVTTASGDIVIDEVGADFRFDSASGDARVSAVAGSVEAKMVSGDLTIGSAAGPSVRVRNLSGDVRLGIPPGRTVDLDLQTMSGSLLNRLEKSGEVAGSRRSLAISMKSVSGSLRLENA